MEPHETHRRSPRSAAPRRKATGQDRGAARCDQAHATIGPVILPSTHCRLYYRLLSNCDVGGQKTMAALTLSGRVKARYSRAYSGGRISTIVLFCTQTSI